MTTETSVTTTGPQVLDVGTRDIAPRSVPTMFSAKPTNLGEAMQFAKLIADSNFIPAAFQGKPGDVLIVMMQAAEMGIGYFQALQNTCVINGRPTIYGDLVIALVQRSGLLEYLLKEWDEEGQVATVRIKRKGFPEKVQSFSMADAERAKLTRNDTYAKYPQRMCMWRAVTWAIRDEFADVLTGITIAEEAIDYSAPASHSAPIAMPQATAKLVDEFLAPPPQEKKSKPAAQTGGSKTSSKHEPEMEVVKISAAKLKTSGNNERGQWKLYSIKLEDGRVVETFSSTAYETALTCKESGTAAYITTKPGRKPGDTMLESIEPVLPEPGDEGHVGGEGGS